jgi:transposase
MDAYQPQKSSKYREKGAWPEDFPRIYEAWKMKEINYATAAKALGIGVNTFYAWGRSYSGVCRRAEQQSQRMAEFLKIHEKWRKQEISTEQAAKEFHVSYRRWNFWVKQHKPESSRKRYATDVHPNYAQFPAIFKLYMADKITGKAAAAKLGVTKVAFFGWVKQEIARTGGPGLLDLKQYKGINSKKFRKQKEFALYYELWRAGLIDGKAVAALLGVCYDSFFNWKRAWEATHDYDALKEESARKAFVFKLWRKEKLSTREAAKRMNIKESQLYEIANRLHKEAYDRDKYLLPA